tara:strand:- start:559 stop:804 length:246 start_codon:yes stop_codon:yes gene_type:complete
MYLKNLNLEEGTGGVGSIFVASNMTLEASKTVFIEGNPAVTMVVGEPVLFYLGWFLVILSFVLKTFNLNILSLVKYFDSNK